MIGSLVVNVEASGGETHLTCAGEFDLATADRFREAVDEVVAAHPRRAHIDCSAVSFIDSIGIRALLHTATRCRESGIELRVTMNPSMRRLFDTVGVTELFTLAS
jgi:anti-anti-sigma factor